jgi:hypothetical protein
LTRTKFRSCPLALPCTCFFLTRDDVACLWWHSARYVGAGSLLRLVRPAGPRTKPNEAPAPSGEVKTETDKFGSFKSALLFGLDGRGTDENDPTQTFKLAAEWEDRVVTRTSLNCEFTYLKRRLSRESWLMAVQPISFMSRSISVCIRLSARSTPAWPAAAKGYK